MDIEKISEEERNEIIEYGIARGKDIFLGTLVTLVLGSFLGIFYQSIIFWLCLSTLRRYAGGYHADSKKRCYFISLIVVFFSLLSIKLVDGRELTGILVQTLNLLLVFALSPVENDNHRLDGMERKKYGIKTKTIAVVLYIVCCFLYFNSVFWIANSIGMACLVVGISLVAGDIKNKQKQL